MSCEDPQQHRESILDRKDAKLKIIRKLPKIVNPCAKIKTIKNGFVTVEGNLQMYYEIEGNPNGVPVVLLPPGPGGTHCEYHPYFSRFKRMCKIIYFDPIGVGQSDYTKIYSIKKYISNLEKLRKHLHIKKWLILGWSFGGLMAQIYLRTVPKVIIGDILLATGLSDDVKRKFGKYGANQSLSRHDFELYQEFNKLKSDYRERYDKESILFWVNFTYNIKWKDQSFYKPTVAEAVKRHTYNSVVDKTYNRQMNESAKAFPLLSGEKYDDIPIIVCDGKFDTIGDRKKMRIMNKMYPKARCIFFECSSHDIFNSEPKKLTKEITKFIIELH
jgi:pimeloyl-ACP methyl ester carboxylesterase